MIAVTAAACSGDTTGGTDQDLPTVGIIQYAAHPSLDNCYTGLMQGIEAAGYKDGENVKIDYQNAQNSTETAEQIAANMVAKNYDVVVGIATPAALAAYGKAQGSNTQVVFCAVSDPVEAKLVADMNVPGGNCTGTSDFLPLEEQLQMIRAFQPDATKIGVLYTTNESNSLSHLKRLEELAPQYGFEIISQGVQTSSDIPQAAASLVAQVDCITNFTDNNVVTNLPTLLSQATAAGVPVYGSEIEQVKMAVSLPKGSITLHSAIRRAPWSVKFSAVLPQVLFRSSVSKIRPRLSMMRWQHSLESRFPRIMPPPRGFPPTRKFI